MLAIPTRLLPFALLLLATPTLTAACSAQDDGAAEVQQPQAKQAEQAAAAEGDHAYVRMSTSLGEMILELDRERAPLTVENFLTYVDDGHYDGTIFHRILSNFMAQGGGFTLDLEQKPTRAPIQNEAGNGLHNTPGTIAMARTGDPHSATSQFFINVVDNRRSLDKNDRSAGYAVFGKVLTGQDTLERIRATPVKNQPRFGGETAFPVTPVVIEKVERVDAAAVEELAAAARDQAQQQARQALQAGLDLLASREIDTSAGTLNPSGVWVLDVAKGSGEKPKMTDHVTVHYTGWLTDGQEFDSSRAKDQPLTLPLSQFIPGWSEGVGGMQVGGKRFLVIPYQLAYGVDGFPPTIPPKATLVFEVELLSIGG